MLPSSLAHASSTSCASSRVSSSARTLPSLSSTKRTAISKPLPRRQHLSPRGFRHRALVGSAARVYWHAPVLRYGLRRRYRARLLDVFSLGEDALDSAVEVRPRCVVLEVDESRIENSDLAAVEIK